MCDCWISERPEQPCTTLRRWHGREVQQNSRDNAVQVCSKAPKRLGHAPNQGNDGLYLLSEHESIKYTPHRLMVGREIHLAVDVMFGHVPDHQPEFSQYIKELRDSLEEA